MSQSKCMMVFRWLASWGIRYKFFVRPISSYVSPSPHQHPPIFFIFFKKVDSSEDWTYSMDRAPRVPAANPRTWWCVGLLHISGNLTVSYAGQEGGGGDAESLPTSDFVKKENSRAGGDSNSWDFLSAATKSPFNFHEFSIIFFCPWNWIKSYSGPKEVVSGSKSATWPVISCINQVYP